MLRRFFGAVRRNHALEHATISVLMGRCPDRRLVGRATAAGFYIYGDVPNEEVDASAKEGLKRLRAGESGLAVSPLCGTNLVVAGVMAGLASVLSAGGNKGRLDRLPSVLLASMLAVLAAQPVGRWIQKRFTTSANVGDLEIVGVHSLGTRQRYHKIETVDRPSN
jgi:hypothetical protein